MKRILRAALCIALPIGAAVPLAAQDTRLASPSEASLEANAGRHVTFREIGPGVSDGLGNVPKLSARHDAGRGTVVFGVERGLGGAYAALMLGEGLVTRFTRRPQQLVHPALSVLWLPLGGAAGEHGAGRGSIAVPLPRDLGTATLRAQVRILDPRTSVAAWSSVIEIRIRGRRSAQK